MPQGSFGETRAFQDFLSTMEDVTWAATSVDLGGGWSMVSVNEGTLNDVVDEEGGILQFLTDTGDNDNVALFSAPLKPDNGRISFEARFKVADDVGNTAIFAGFSETLAKDTPVIPASVSGTTVTYAGSGGMLGLLWDSDQSTNTWRAISGDGGAVSGSANYGANGTTATDVAVANQWDIVRVELSQSGIGEIWHDDELVASGATGLTVTDLFYPLLLVQNLTGAALEVEVDYLYARGHRDWTVS